jgi:hypothetical protein
VLVQRDCQAEEEQADRPAQEQVLSDIDEVAAGELKAGGGATRERDYATEAAERKHRHAPSPSLCRA